VQIGICNTASERDSPARFFTSAFFTDRLLPSLLLDIERLFALASNSQVLIDSRAIIFCGESILPATTESCDSPHRFSGESLFVRIICINSRLSFNTRVDTPRIVYYGESLLPVSFIAGSHCWQWRVIFKNIEGLPLPLKGQWSKKWTTLVPLEYLKTTFIRPREAHGGFTKPPDWNSWVI
jgi:hypothetical protein